MITRRAPIGIGLAIAGLLALPAGASAFSSGITSQTFGTTGCGLCHSGGVAPSVFVTGPSQLAAGETGEYVLTILGSAAQDGAGFNAAAVAGALATGGPFAIGTQGLSGSGGRTEVTHTAPKVGAAVTTDPLLRLMRFSFTWTAPNPFPSAVDLRAWGNAVNRSGSSSGDAPSLATLAVSPPGAPFSCDGATPPEPAIVADPAAQSCQRTIAKAGALYVKLALKAVQSCLKAVHAGVVPDDPSARCVGDPATGTPPTDPKAAAALAKAEAKLSSLVFASCDDAAVAPLGLCGATGEAAADCLLVAHRQRVAEAIEAQYGELLPSADAAARKCQAAIGKSSADFVNAYLKASQKCLDARNKSGSPAGGVAACIGSAPAGTFLVPGDAKVASAIAKATAAFATKVLPACPDRVVASLDACARDGASLAECLACTQRKASFDLLAAEYGGD